MVIKARQHAIYEMVEVLEVLDCDALNSALFMASAMQHCLGPLLHVFVHHEYGHLDSGQSVEHL